MNQPGDNNKTSDQVEDQADDIKGYISALNSEDKNSVELIDSAVSDGSLDEETAFVYKIYSVFGDKRLPEEYKSLTPHREGTPLIREMNKRWDSFNEDTKALLDPYRKRPNEEGSWVWQRFDDIENKNETSWVMKKAHATRASSYTDYLVDMDGKVKIWYPTVSGKMNNIYAPGKTEVDASTGKKMAEKIQRFLDEDGIIPEYEDLLNKKLMSDGSRGGDGKFDIYVAPCGSDLGLTYGEGSTPTTSYIIMNYAIGLNKDNVLKTTLAHELFHAFQYVYDYDDTRDNWWSEATAVWAEDYIYPIVNSEHGWLPRFIPHPTTQADKETPPSAHHYGAYILPYFITLNFGDDFMRKSWEACEQKKCIDGIDENIDGGFKKQWKEFTLYNYNKDPANLYVDAGPFPPISSWQSSEAEDIFIMFDGEIDVDVGKIAPLAADLAQVHNALEKDTEVKRLTFKDLKKFSDKADEAGIKAVIYYKNGKKQIEDWSERDQRSFCVASPEEDFERIVLIFSNGNKENPISSTTVKVETKNNCFYIDEDAKRTAVLHFPYADGGAMNVVDINTTIDTVARGETVKKANDEVKYAYQTDWRVKYEFEQVKDAFSFSCMGSSVDYESGWTTRAAGYLTFNLDPNSEGYKDDTFPIDMHYGEIHPNGPYEDVPSVNVQCAGLPIGATKIDLSSYKGVSENIYTGRITEMTPDGAKIEIENCCLYHDCTTQQGAPFQSISKPVILEIKRK